MSAAKKVAYQVIPREAENGRVRDVYKLAEELIKKHHKRLEDASFSIAWCYTWKETKDGRLKLCDVKRASEVDRQLHEQDFVILLNDETWNHSTFTDEQRRALMDHALCMMDVSEDSDGEVRVDENDRIVYTKRQPDIVEFSECLQRNGIWTHELERAAAIIADEAARPLLGSPMKPKEEEEPAAEAKPEPEAAEVKGTHEPVIGRNVKLTKDIGGYNDRVNGLRKGVVLAAEPGSNGAAKVRAGNGVIVTLDPDQFEYIGVEA